MGLLTKKQILFHAIYRYHFRIENLSNHIREGFFGKYF